MKKLNYSESWSWSEIYDHAKQKKENMSEGQMGMTGKPTAQVGKIIWLNSRNGEGYKIIQGLKK